jgi:chromosome segregation protein
VGFLHFIRDLSREKGYLRFSKLRLTGFKSFVDSTDLVISDGLTGVVGPNGCGKSNLLEALRWVMGENRPTAMRGSGMDDVIFSGTASRSAKNFAEVALKIDNSDRSAPAQYAEFSEFEVIRRIARDSGSAYKVNSKDARARDVQMLFADASTGAHSPALVRQGQIAELINAKPKSRRRILEEAAGISGLYQRRHEAELKLSGADTNLSRLDDTIEQLASQLGHLAKQAKQALRYREIGEELRKLEGQLLYIKWKEAESIRASAELEKKKSQLRASEAEAEAKKFFNEREVFEGTLPKLREDNSNSAIKLQNLLVQREFLVNSKRQVLQDISKLKSDIDQLEFDITRETSLNQDAVDTLKRLEIEKLELTQAGDNYSSKVEIAIEESRVSALDLQGLELQLSNKTEDNARLIAQHQSAEGLYEELKVTLERIKSEEKKANMELEASRIIVTSESLKATEAKDKFSAAKIEFELADTQLEKINLSRNDIQSKEAQARATSSEAEGIETALRAESGAVSRLLDREISEVKQIIDRIKVQPGYELALGAAFQDDLKNPEVEKDFGTGWISLKSDYTSQSLPPDVEPLSSFVSGPELLSRRIAQIGVVSNKLGAKLQSQLMPGQRLVSKEGACWRWDGFKVEAVDASTSSALRLQQLNRLEELKQELEQAISKSLGSRQAHTSLQAELLELTNFDQETRLTWQNADKLMIESNRVMSSAESEKSIAEGKVENLLLTVARYKNETNNIQNRLLEAEKAIKSLGDLQSVRDELDKLKEEVVVSRTTMISKRGLAETLRTENEIRVLRFKEIDEHLLVWISRREYAEDRIKELKSRQVMLEDKLEISEKRPNELVFEKISCKRKYSLVRFLLMM